MPVFAVRNETNGNLGYCNFYEGTNPRRLNYGVYDDGVKERLLFVQDVVAPVIAEAVRRAGGIRLKPLMQRACTWATSCTAATLPLRCCSCARSRPV